MVTCKYGRQTLTCDSRLHLHPAFEVWMADIAAPFLANSRGDIGRGLARRAGVPFHNTRNRPDKSCSAGSWRFSTTGPRLNAARRGGFAER